MDEPEHRSAAPPPTPPPNANQNKRFEFKIKYDHTFSHNGNVRSQNGLSIVVREADLTQTHADCLLNYFLVGTKLVDIVSNQLGEKAGLGYQVELTSQVSTRRLRSAHSDDCMIFHTSAGKLTNCKHIIHLGQNYMDSSNLAKKFKSLFNAYLQLFDYVESQLSVQSLAIRMIGDNEDRDLSIISLIEALNQYYFHKTVCLKTNIKIRQHANLRELLIVCLDPLPLIVLQEYLTNGFQTDFLSQLFDENSDDESDTIVHEDTRHQVPTRDRGHEEQKESRTITDADYDYGSDDDDFDTLQAKFLSMAPADRQKAPSLDVPATNHGDACVKCQKIGELAFVTWEKNRLYNHLIDFKGCLKRSGGRTCEICTIFANLLKINVKELLQGVPTFNASAKGCVCLRCYFELFMDKLCKSHCSSCLREMPQGSAADDNANKQCRKHNICVRCSFLPKNMSYCYYCTVFKLYHTMFDHVSTSSHHDNIDCCFGYLDYELVSAGKSVAESKKKMACGHMAFPDDLSLPGADQQPKANVCGFCTMTKLTNMVLVRQRNEVDYEIVDDLDIDEEFEDEEQQHQQQVTDDEEQESGAATTPNVGTHDVNNNENSKDEPTIYTHIKYLAEPLPGHPNINTIELQFFIPNGVQKVSCQSFHLPNFAVKMP